MIRPISFGAVLLLVLLLVIVATLTIPSSVAASSSSNSNYLNVYGQPLQSCSSNGMALTGYTRTGYCVDQKDDEGSHHICIDLSSTVNNDDGNTGNFCDVTGQYDWCSSQDMECDTINGGGGNWYNNNNNNNYGGGCAIQNWCVCQWAFASYLYKAGGCDSIQTIVCESINLEAILAYQEQSGYEKYETALQCIVDRCGLDINNLPVRQQQQQQHNGINVQSSSQSTMGLLMIIVLLASVAFGVVYFMTRHRNSSSLIDSATTKSGLLS